MDIKKFAPWNWFKKEEEEAGSSVPVVRSDGLNGTTAPSRGFFPCRKMPIRRASGPLLKRVC